MGSRHASSAHRESLSSVQVIRLALRTWSWILALVTVGAGVQYLWPGAPDTAPSLQLMERALSAHSMAPYGFGLASAGVLIAVGLLRGGPGGMSWDPRWCMAGHLLASLVNLFWAGCAVAVLLQGVATGVGVAQPAGYAALHCAGLLFTRWAAHIAGGD